MQPQYIAYQNSAHAKVKCVACHVGEEADWYVKSKMSGLRSISRCLSKTHRNSY